MVSYKADLRGNVFSGSVLYEPDLTTYRHAREESLYYRNPDDNRFYFRITFDVKASLYHAEKYRELDQIAIAGGNNWNTFFIQVGMIGVTKGERCTIREERRMSAKIIFARNN